MEKGVISSSAEELKELNLSRAIMLLFVVICHSTPLDEVTNVSSNIIGTGIVECIVTGFCRACVPVFFAISGFLFFRNVRQWDWKAWKSKLGRRAVTLLIPYMLWNVIASLLFLFKVRYMGSDGFGVFADGSFNPLRYLEGFWRLNDGYPYDYPLWFLRNLIVLCIFAPLVYLLARRTAVFLVAFVLFLCVFQHTESGELPFVIGAWLGMHPGWYRRFTVRKIAIAMLVVWIIAAFLLVTVDMPDKLHGMLKTTRDISAISAVLGLCGLADADKMMFLMRKLLPATFFIYAFHGLMRTVVAKACLSLTGDNSSISILIAFFLIFAILIVVSYIAYRLCKLFTPRLCSLLCGGRI
ncbi:MAG: acyltransferase family protein [Muribaculaceae bacterium]